MNATEAAHHLAFPPVGSSTFPISSRALSLELYALKGQLVPDVKWASLAAARIAVAPPRSLLYLPQLQLIGVWGNMGSGVSNAWSVKRRIQEQTEAQNPLESANLSAMALTSIPNMSKMCPLISSLNASNNIITALPEHVQRFLNLTTLDVSSNQLTTLPEFLSAIVRLKELRASDNNIRELPDGLVLPSLASLTLCRNYLDRGLSPLLCQSCQSSLQLLHLSSNGLGYGTAPKTILILSALVDLDLSLNNLGGDVL